MNARGGIQGRSIVLNTLDDQYDVQKGLANVKQLMADPNTFALFNCMGTANVEAMLPLVLESGIPFFAPFTGAQLSRVPQRNVFNIRASYAEEAEKLVQHLNTLGIKRIAIAYQANSFGKEVFNATQRSMAKLGLPDSRAEAEALGADWLTLLQAQSVDFTLAWRYLGEAAEGREERLRTLFADGAALAAWLQRWHRQCTAADGEGGKAGVAGAAAMSRHNPWLIPRNHQVEAALDAAEQGDLAPFHRLLGALAEPYREQPRYADLAEPAPREFMRTFQTFCGT